MATSDLHVVTNDAGDHFVGLDIDGTFVPVASVGAARIKQLQERAANLSALSEADDADSQKRHDEAASGLPYKVQATTTSKPDKGAKGGEV
jgi:hypothetical protein